MNIPLVLAVDGLAVPAPGAAPTRPTLGHCLLLAALLHLWLVALVGTAPGGSAKPGEGVWGAIQIRLGGSGPADTTGRSDTPLPSTGPVGRAPEPRFGGTVREAEPRPLPEPGAAELGLWGPRPSPSPLTSSAAPAQAQPEPAPTAPIPPVLTRRETRAADRREDQSAPAAVAPAVPEPPARPVIDGTPAPSTAPRLAPVDTVEAPVLERPVQAQRDIALPTPAPAAAARPQPAPAPQREEKAVAAPAPVVAQPLLRPVPVPDAPAPVAAPSPAPPVPTPTPAPPPPAAAELPAQSQALPQPVSPPEPMRAMEPPPVLAPAATAPEPQPAAAQAPAAVAPPVPTRTLRPVDALAVPRSAAPELVAPAAAAAPRSADPAPVAPPAATPATPATPTPAAPTAPGPSTVPVGPTAGSPDAGQRQGSDRATAPSAPASAPRLNLELPRARATLPGLASPRVLNLVPPPPERKSALAEAIEKAAKPDCRKAYAGMGLLAVVPLAADAARDGGCRW